MSELLIGSLTVGLLFVLILSGIHVAFALVVMSFLGMLLLTDFNVAESLLQQTANSAVSELVFAVVPLFLMMGAFMTNSRGASDLYALMHYFVRKVRGGLAIATVFANAAFASVTGVSIASAVIFSKIAYPEMRRHGYSKGLALGSVAGSSILGMLIPPSVLLVLYGILTQVSIGDLFLAGILPGVLLTAMYSAMIVVMAYRRPAIAGVGAVPISTASSLGVTSHRGEDDHDSHNVLNAGAPNVAETSVLDNEVADAYIPPQGLAALLLRAGPIGMLFILVIGGIWGGLFTPTEAAAVGAFGGMIVAFLTGMRMTGFLNSFRETAMAAGSIMLLLVAAQMYTRMLALSGIVRSLGDEVISWALPATGVVILFVVLCLLLGAVLDSSSIILLTVPLFFPVIQLLGIDPLWFGIVMIVAVEVGLIIPPFGMVAFAMSGVLRSEATVEEVFRGAIPFIATMLIFIATLIAFPSLVTWLPEVMR